MEEQAVIRLNQFLGKHNMSLETITKKQEGYLEKIDEAIQARLKKIEHARETLSNQAITVVNIAKDIGISRGTFYTEANEILRKYVEEYSDASTGKVIPEAEYAALKERYDDTERELRQFVLRDTDIEDLKDQVEKSEKEKENLNKRIKNLEEDYSKLYKEIEEMRNAKIIPFDNDDDKKKK